MAFAKYYRWSDNDRRAGPFIYSRDSRGYRPIALVLSSGKGEDQFSDPGCTLRASAFGHTLLISLPAIIKPYARWVDCSMYEWAKDRPNSGYWDRHSREFGFSLTDGYLQFVFGPQTHDSSTTKSRGYFLPWRQWRHVRRSLYGLQGEHFRTIPERKAWTRDAWLEEQAAEDACPSASFAFLDFDGEALTASTRIEEREWRFGTGWFRWLSIFRKPRVKRSLDIRFSGETGERKGSWKGGTIGHSIDMQPSELHEAAFRRYCAGHKMTMTGPA